MDRILNPTKEQMLSGSEITSLVESYFKTRAGTDSGLWAVYSTYIDSVFRLSIAFTERFAESPIEKLLATSMLIAAINEKKIWSLKITTPTTKTLREFCNTEDEFSSQIIRLKKAFSNPKDLFDKLDLIAQELVKEGEFKDFASAKRVLYDQAIFYIFGEDKEFGGRKAVHMTPQVEFADVCVDGKKIRADWVAWTPDSFKRGVVIECDGYAYHSNRNSFNRDRRRSRELQKLGFTVMNFSGAEINKDPLGCGEEIYKYTRQFFTEERTHFYPVVGS